MKRSSTPCITSARRKCFTVRANRVDEETMRIVLLMCVVMAVGCARTETYDVTVKNELQQPVTIWLTKVGGSIESQWFSPEELAMGTRPNERIAGAALAPGKTGHTTQKAQMT